MSVIGEPTAHRLTGWSGDSRYFVMKEHTEILPEAVLAVLRGEIAGVMFKRVVDPDVSARISERFWASAARQKRGAEAPGYFIGAFHYGKTTADYLNEAERAVPGLAGVLDVADDPVASFKQAMRSELARHDIDFRLANNGGRTASEALLRSWHGEGTFALAPHEDFSQCQEPQQADFEIQRVADYTVVALNLCLENGEGGKLVLWNVIPDEASRARLGVTYTGSPYPVETVASFEKIEVPVEAGDVYVFNGAHVHAVESGTAGRRTTAAAILGFIDDRTVVSWT